MIRQCNACGVGIYKYNKTGFCQPCFRASDAGIAVTKRAAAKSSANRSCASSAERLARYQIRGSKDECWEWSGCNNGVGYPVLRINKRLKVATHIALELDGRPQPSVAHHACHHCDNPICTNPEHLFWGTVSDNMQDMIKKGRGGHQKLRRCGAPILEQNGPNCAGTQSGPSPRQKD